jgi:glycine cleavage system pyridoxal-binding protein P
MVIELTGMEIPMHHIDSTAAAEAMAYCLMFVRDQRKQCK